MIILKVQVPHTHTEGKKVVKKRKKDGKRKLSVPVLSNRKPDKIYC